MSAGLTFDESTAAALEAIYKTPDIVAQRGRVLEALALHPGERVLDGGVGPGLLAYDMARIVGETGRTVGFDARRYVDPRDLIHVALQHRYIDRPGAHAGVAANPERYGDTAATQPRAYKPLDLCLEELQMLG